MAMAERVGVQDEYYQFLWAKPGQEIKDGLQTIEGEADILTCIGEDGLNGKHHLLKVFVKKMTRFQAWKRMVDIQKQLCDLVPDIGDGFRLEELGDDGTPIREAVGGSGLSVIPNPLLLGCSATAEGVVDQSAPDKPDQNTYHESSTNEPAKVGEAAIEDMNPPVLTDQGTHGVDEIEGDHAIHPATEVTEADQFAEGSTRWLDIDEILAEMHNEMQAEAEADQIQVNDDNYSFSSPSIYSSPSQHDFWDGRYNAYSSEDSDRPFNSRHFSREPTPISSDESDETYTPEGFENANLSTDSSDCDPLPGIERHDSNDDSGNGEQSDSRSVHRSGCKEMPLMDKLTPVGWIVCVTKKNCWRSVAGDQRKTMRFNQISIRYSMQIEICNMLRSSSGKSSSHSLHSRSSARLMPFRTAEVSNSLLMIRSGVDVNACRSVDSSYMPGSVVSQIQSSSYQDNRNTLAQLRRTSELPTHRSWQSIMLLGLGLTRRGL
ncbi:hypothetical protein LINPERHAP2_LOCUS39825 [Linum perenne]